MKIRSWSFILFFIIPFFAADSIALAQTTWGDYWGWEVPKTGGNNLTTSFRGENGNVVLGGDRNLGIVIRTYVQPLFGLHINVEDHITKGIYVAELIPSEYLFLSASFDYLKSNLLSYNSSGGTKVIKSFDTPVSSFSIIDKNHAVAVGNKEIIVVDRRTGEVVNDYHGPVPDDPGNTFTDDFDDIETLPNGRGIIVGSNSSIYTTDDFTKYDKAGVDLHDIVDFSAVGSAGFTVWFKKTAQSIPIFAIGNQWTTNSGVIVRSTDDGATWDSVFAVPNVTLKAISAGSSTNAIISGNSYSGGVLYYTNDGGDTWKKGDDSTDNIYSITHISADSAYAVGARGLILLTTDGGEHWTQISDDDPGFSGIYFSSPSVGYAVSLSGSSSNILSVYKTIDAGDNWNITYVDSSFSPAYAFLNSLFFIDNMTGFIAGSKFIKTTDGGGTWNTVNSGVASSDTTYPDPAFQDVYFVNHSLGFAIFRDYSTGDGVIKTTDGGTTWNPVNINNDKNDKRFIYFADENLGFVSGYSTLYRTTDGGDTWDTLAVAYGSTPGYFEDLNSKVTFVNSSTGFFGRKGHIFKTTDKGDTWIGAPIDDYTEPRHIQFLSDSTGYAICTSDTFGLPLHVLYKTTDGGNSWSDVTNKLPGSTGFQSMFFTDEHTGFLAGSAGIIKTTTGGDSVATSVRQTENSIVPSAYMLFQNYPNPFNPTTTIRYQLPAVAHVTLKVYDILGREVTTLVDDVKGAGMQQVQFNASQLASGLYFYTFRTGSFTATKKLLLMK